MKTYKLKEFGKENWIRICDFCDNNEICNVCTYRPQDIEKHYHKFRYVKTLIKANFIRRLFNREYETQMYTCVCGKVKQEGYFIKKLPIDWEWDFY